MDEFEEWWRSEFVGPGSAIGVDKEFARRIWLESASRADRKARIECAEICRDVHRNYECSRIGADLCKHAIRATIKEPPA